MDSSRESVYSPESPLDKVDGGRESFFPQPLQGIIVTLPLITWLPHLCHSWQGKIFTEESFYSPESPLDVVDSSRESFYSPESPLDKVDGGRESFFPQPLQGQSLLHYLSSHDFHTCATLDKVRYLIYTDI